MVILTARGNTIRSMIRHFSDQLHDNEYNFPPFPTQSPTAQTEIGKLAMDILNILSGNEAIALINKAMDNKQKVKIEPLNTVCHIPISIFIIALFVRGTTW